MTDAVDQLDFFTPGGAPLATIVLSTKQILTAPGFTDTDVMKCFAGVLRNLALTGVLKTGHVYNVEPGKPS